MQSYLHDIDKLGRSRGLRAIFQVLTADRRKGPCLDFAPYPEAQVAYLGRLGGGGLRIVLYPGAEEGRVEIGLTGLEPACDYRASGSLTTEFRSDAEGKADLAVDLHGRLEIRIHPWTTS